MNELEYPDIISINIMCNCKYAELCINRLCEICDIMACTECYRSNYDMISELSSGTEGYFEICVDCLMKHGKSVQLYEYKGNCGMISVNYIEVEPKKEHSTFVDFLMVGMVGFAVGILVNTIITVMDK